MKNKQLCLSKNKKSFKKSCMQQIKILTHILSLVLVFVIYRYIYKSVYTYVGICVYLNLLYATRKDKWQQVL